MSETSREVQQNTWPTHEQLDNARWHERATRRFVLKAGAGVATAGAMGSIAMKAFAQNSGSSAATAVASPAAESSSATAVASGVCVLTPELTVGPYYLDDLLVRSDITEGKKAGVPLDLKISVVSTVDGCTPIENAAVDVWHCDAKGFYSGFTESSPGGTGSYVDDGSDPDTFLRGVMLTDADGVAEFATIYPGWYVSRDIHIHMKVHVGGATDDGTYDGGTVAHIGQLAFDDTFSERIAKESPYNEKTDTFTRISEDSVFVNVEDDDPTFFLTLTPNDDSDLTKGIVATITVGVDPSVDNDQQGMGGGGGGRQGGPGGGQGGPNGTPPAGGQGGPGGARPEGTPPGGMQPPSNEPTATPTATATATS
ncbi:MAG: intradiol ring-cleavage dioxygenase [Thermomicrobiales bacterium]